MKSAILYATTKPPAPGDYSRMRAKDLAGKLYVIWVRAAIVNDDVSGALDKAKPRPRSAKSNGKRGIAV